MDDSDRNILRSLMHEADEPCVVCGEPQTPDPYTGKFAWAVGDVIYCEEDHPLLDRVDYSDPALLADPDYVRAPCGSIVHVDDLASHDPNTCELCERKRP